ncbi:MAG: VapB-type antitoxin [Candidatus Bathyarchaeia archaeon]
MRDVGAMTTISITDDVKRELLKVAAELQLRRGRRVDLNEAVRYLVTQRRRKNPELLKEACGSLDDAREAIAELLAERRLDEERTERKTRPRR